MLAKRGQLLVNSSSGAKQREFRDAARRKGCKRYVLSAGRRLNGWSPSKDWARQANSRGRAESEFVEFDMKSRLVAREDKSRVVTRSSSPSADKDAVFPVVSFAASRRLPIGSACLGRGYLQGE